MKAKRFDERLAAGLEILLVALAGPLLAFLLLNLAGVREHLASSWALFRFSILESGLTLALIASLMRLNKRSWAGLGLRWRGAAMESALGAAAVPLLFLAGYAAIQGFRLLWPEWASTDNPMLDLIREASDALLILAASLVAGGIKEEVQRAFVLDRFEKGLGSVWAGLVLWSLFFGLMHLVQGADRAAGAAVLGFLFGLLYLRRRHLAAPMTAHALYDALVVFFAA